jgi:hypothetical protein
VASNEGVEDFAVAKTRGRNFQSERIFLDNFWFIL